MAHSLETRLPFLDNDLVDFAQRVPVGLKLGNLGEVVRLNENEPGPKTQRFFERTRDGKLLLRQAMERYIPPDVTEREKQGFSAPDATWFRGESIDYVRRTLLDGDAAIYEYLDRDAVQRARRRPPRGPREPAPADLVAALGRAVVRDVPRRRGLRSAASSSRVPSKPRFIRASTNDRPGTKPSPAAGCGYFGWWNSWATNSIPASANLSSSW